MSAVSKRISKRVKANEEKLTEPRAKKLSLSNSMQKLQLEQEKEKEKKEEEIEEGLEEEVVEVQATTSKGKNKNTANKTMEKVQTEQEEEKEMEEGLEEEVVEVQATTSKGKNKNTAHKTTEKVQTEQEEEKEMEEGLEEEEVGAQASTRKGKNQNKPKKLASTEPSVERSREIAELKKQLRKSNKTNFIILYYCYLIIFQYKGEARLAELGDQEEKREDPKKRGPKPKRNDEEKSKFLTVKYSIDEEHPLKHLDGKFFAVDLQNLTCKFNPNCFKVGDHVEFMKIYKDEVIPLEGNCKLLNLFNKINLRFYIFFKFKGISPAVGYMRPLNARPTKFRDLTT